ncbi:MAG: hypothetical protein KF883_00815 [Thermomicrobiales bacterium]|nr:hypothetical protein [Thermomicrobiales bacterium]
MQDSLIEAYFRIAFHLERHVPGYIDAYFGDPARKERLTGESLLSAKDLTALAEALGRDLATASLPASRKDYLLKQVAAMETVARKVAGESIGYIDEVSRCFDITPERTPDALLESALDDLDQLLPGSGDVTSRMGAWRARTEVDIDGARLAIDLILEEARRRTLAFIDLPAHEAVEISFVNDKPWRGYNWYLGDCRSLVEINTDLPQYASFLVELMAHEAYPGHHTEHAVKGEHLYKALGYEEMAIQLINTPECVIHEGIATTAHEIIFPGEEALEWENAVLYPALGLDPLPESTLAVRDAHKRLRSVAGDAALMRHVDGASDDDVVAFLMRYGLSNEEQSRHRLRFIDDPLWRPYIFTYHVGYDILRDWFGDADTTTKREMFRTLLTGQHTPSGLRAESTHD